MPYEAIYVVLGPGPVVLTCPACNTRVTTYTRTAPNPMTHCLAACLCILGCWLCCCLPYFCVPPIVRHYCPRCGAYLGSCS
ncbi:unnamed protein product [Acanthoscelides obtectus]|uniref:LITAF domain-containing protein n=1 Tax=Acanthoscelides obtectus TaxID=200917 RepID=A0A9P0P734_ACAOB|nr:unnamed protein product [Acanthoscelides obtectus]CAK1622886.1 hypothetical protein AOBTE_LOCUS1709 [Acanthoscelides obtectus]